MSGPLRTPANLSGSAEVDNLDVKLQVELTSAGPVRVSLKNGLATLEQVHITGQDTDLQASGTVQAFEEQARTKGSSTSKPTAT